MSVGFALLLASALSAPAIAQRNPVLVNASQPWSQLAKLTSNTADYFYNGPAVAVGDGVVVVGSNYGQQVSVYVNQNGNWKDMVETATLKASDEMGCDVFGTSVSISGNTIAVGDSGCYGTQSGAVYVFVEPVAGWSGTLTETAKLTASDAATNAALGTSVSIDGDTIVAGAPASYATGLNGAAYIWTKPPAGWTSMTQTAELTSSDGVAGDEFGNSVSISSNNVAVGAPSVHSNHNHSGAAYVFVKPSSGWANATQNAELLASDPLAYGSMGISVGISGRTVVAGAYADVGSHVSQGAAYVFVEPSGGWHDTTQVAELTASNGHSEDLFGTSVAIDGDLIVVGAIYFSGPSGRHTSHFFDEGAAFVFQKPASGWMDMTQSAQLNGADARLATQLGTRVAVHGQIVAAGVPNGNRNPGTAYVFRPFTPQ